MSLTSESSVTARHVESAPFLELGDAPRERTQFLQPAAGRMVTGVGLPDGRLQQVLRHHGSVARRIVLGRQILKIVRKGCDPV